MKLHQIALAVAVMAAGSASATEVLTFSGATALNKSFEKAVSDLCATTGASTDRTTHSSIYNTKGNTTTRYRCLAKAGLGIAGVSDGEELIIYKEGGGSSTGVTKLVGAGVATNIALTSGCTATTTGSLISGGPVFTKNSGCGNTTSGTDAIPDAGLSDTEPKLVSIGGSVAGITAGPVVAQVFGIVVSDNIYQKLQAEQGKTVGDYSEDQAPSLPSSFVRGAFNGSTTDWTGLDADLTADDNRSGEDHPDQAAWDDANTNSTAIKVCRRATGSGTLATFEASVMLSPCSTSNTYGGALLLSSAAGDDAGSFSTSQDGESDVYHVVESGAQEAVDTCLTKAYYQGEMAIGIMGGERQFGDTGSKTGGSDDNDGVQDKWHYVKINQVYPSVANFIAGDYDFYWGEASFNVRDSNDGNAALIAKIKTELGSPVSIASIPLPGLAAIPSGDFPFDYGVSQVGRATRGGNTCSPSYQVY